MRAEARNRLHWLARARGIQTSYRDAEGVRRTASPEALIAVLQALGEPVARAEDARDALREHERRSRSPGIEPVHVAWDGELPGITATLPASARSLEWSITLEDGASRTWTTPGGNASRRGAAARRWRTGIDSPLPLGHHELRVRAGGEEFATRVIASPRTAFSDPDRIWGLFLPLYALRTRDRLADYGDLRELTRWTGALGGDFFGTLPLLPTFLENPFEPSPYAPVSRLFWSELFIDTDRLPGTTPSRPRRPERAGNELVDYGAAAEARRRVLRDAADRFFDAGGERDAGFRAYLNAHPDARSYARFRATGLRRGVGWQAWPQRLRDGRIRAGDFDPADEALFLYAAWTADAQVGAVAAEAKHGGAALYLDLPLGVHPDGYDTWSRRGLFATGVSAGAPPDALFRGGQDWGFPPLDPNALRRSGYDYLMDSITHHLRHARMLRLDHVMALQRLYWIPRGMPADQGVYVRYPLDELFAVLTLESRRYRATLIGEDLGTVSREIRAAMKRHHVRRMYVLQYEARADRRAPLPAVPADVIASLNTHDMPPFAAFWHGADLVEQHELGWLSEQETQAQRRSRDRLRSAIARGLDMARRSRNGAPPARRVLDRLLRYLGESAARAVVVNLEDLWLEERPQNVPGTHKERPNWRRKARYGLDRIRRDPEIRRKLAFVSRSRIEKNDHA